jgi:glutamate-ammonia-ligase adenylyltransferase
VATHIEAFRKYQRQDAWTWEQMALSRARPIAGDPGLCEELGGEVAAILALSRDAAKVRREASDMRKLIEEEKPPRDMWDLKLVPGGQIDLEFIAQVAVLSGWTQPGFHSTATGQVLTALRPEIVDADTQRELGEAHRLYTTLTQTIRLCLTSELDPADIPRGLEDLLLRNTDLPDMKVLTAHMRATAGRVRTHFDHLLGAGSGKAKRRRSAGSNLVKGNGA